MAKKQQQDPSELALKHLKNFHISGAKFKSPGNIPTGHFALDFAIHYGTNPSKVDLNNLDSYDPKVHLGLPLGRIVEIFGEEGGGKSSLAYRVVGNAQKLGYTAAWIDAEHSFSESLAYVNGCNVDNIISPNETLYAEEALDFMAHLCYAKEVPMWKGEKQIKVPGPKVIVLDSIASLVPLAKAEINSEQQYMGLLPRIMSANLGNVAQAAEENGVLLILINQLREKIGITYGDSETSPGGHALKHFFSLILKVTKKKSKEASIFRVEDDEEILIGGHSYVRLVKNRFSKPFFESLEIPIYYEPYFPDIEDIAFQSGRQLKLISVRKGVFSWNDVKIEGQKDFIKHIKENNLVDQLVNDIKASSKEQGAILPPELVLYEVPLDEEGDTDDNVERDLSGDGEGANSSGSKNVAKKKRRGKSTSVS